MQPSASYQDLFLPSGRPQASSGHLRCPPGPSGAPFHPSLGLSQEPKLIICPFSRTPVGLGVFSFIRIWSTRSGRRRTSQYARLGPHTREGCTNNFDFLDLRSTLGVFSFVRTWLAKSGRRRTSLYGGLGSYIRKSCDKISELRRNSGWSWSIPPTPAELRSHRKNSGSHQIYSGASGPPSMLCFY